MSVFVDPLTLVVVLGNLIIPALIASQALSNGFYDAKVHLKTPQSRNYRLDYLHAMALWGAVAQFVFGIIMVAAIGVAMIPSVKAPISIRYSTSFPS